MSSKVTARVEKMRLKMYRFNEDPFPPLQRTGTARVYPYPMQDDVTDPVQGHWCKLYNTHLSEEQQCDRLKSDRQGGEFHEIVVFEDENVPEG